MQPVNSGFILEAIGLGYSIEYFLVSRARQGIKVAIIQLRQSGHKLAACECLRAGPQQCLHERERSRSPLAHARLRSDEEGCTRLY